MVIDMLYGERLSDIRKDKQIKQYELATIIGICKGVYNQYEREYVIIPTKHLNTLCNYFEVSFDYIFGFTNDFSYSDIFKDINKDLSGRRLKELRKSMKITQVNFAKELNVSRTTITEYERGTNIIATPFLYTICNMYGISADYLLGKTNEPKYWK